LELPRFLGIDFGWRSQPSGLCCLELQGNDLHLIALDRLGEPVAILAWVDQWATSTTVVAVDAPTIIPNPTGARLPDRLTHQLFGKYDAGCYPANLGRPFADRTVALGKALTDRGFCHAPTILPRKVGRYQIEVFPHPAIVHLFGLDRILKYKKGKLTDRSRELNRLKNYIETVLSAIVPPLKLSHPLPEIPTNGKQLKEMEDQLDSLICAYVGAYWWYWGAEKNLTLGDETNGYIIVPTIVNSGT
jgi:predicted RNase H-like nuclease